MTPMDLICELPDESLLLIFSYLDGKHLARCSMVCSRYFAIIENSPCWKRLCEFDWDATVLPENVTSWRECYTRMYRSFGPYVDCYKRVKRCWDRIFAIAQERCPLIYGSILRDGKEEYVDNLDKLIGPYGRLPLEYRCSYRFCNGQRPVREDMLASGTGFHAGLLGAYDEEDFGDYMRSCNDTPEMPHNRIFDRVCCLSLVTIGERSSELPHGRYALCIRDGAGSPSRNGCQCDAVHERLHFRVVSFREDDTCRWEFFIYYASFAVFLEDFSKRITNYPVVNNRFLKFDFNSRCDTGPFTVTVRTAFFRERSRAFPPEHRQFHFFYRITMSMHADASPLDSCQLETRHWTITDANGEVDTVNGPGVVGNFPVMRPGAEFTWISRTSYQTTTGKMSGYFTMQKLNTGLELRIECPEFNLVAPEFVQG